MSSTQAAKSSSGEGAGTIDVTDLDLAQLQDVRRQLEAELQHLTQSFGQLKAAQSKFRGCIDAIDGLGRGGSGSNNEKVSLIPLTPSLYVPGKLTDPSKVIVDIGTGYYVEKAAGDAKKMYVGKIEFVNKSLEQLQETIQRKQDNLRVVADVMKVKIVQAQQQQQGQGPAAVTA